MFLRRAATAVLKQSINSTGLLETRHLATVQKGSQVVEQRKTSLIDVENFSKLTGDFNSVHFGETAIVHGVLLNGYVSAVLGTKLPGPGYVVVEQSMTFPNPCRVGDDLEILVEVVEARKILCCKYVCTSVNQKCVVHQGTVKLMKFKGLK